MQLIRKKSKIGNNPDLYVLLLLLTLVTDRLWRWIGSFDIIEFGEICLQIAIYFLFLKKDVDQPYPWQLSNGKIENATFERTKSVVQGFVRIGLESAVNPVTIGLSRQKVAKMIK